MRIEVAGLSDIGRIRSSNDDHYCIGTFVEQAAPTALSVHTRSTFFERYGLLAAVADGMGGYAGGSVASRVTLEALSARFYAQSRERTSRAAFADFMRLCLAHAQNALKEALKSSPDLFAAGTTLAGVALMPPDSLVVFHIGDSRVLRASGGFVRSLTIDHTPIGADVASGRLTEQEAGKVPGSSQLTRSLGLKGDAAIDINQELTWTPGDQFLICTDGLYGLGRGATREFIKQAACAGQSAVGLATQIVGEAVRCDGHDNATFVVVQVYEETGDADGTGNAANS